MSAEDVRQEQAAFRRFKRRIDLIVNDEHAWIVAGRGDGNGGYMLETLRDALRRAGLYRDESTPAAGFKKMKINADLRRRVFERDAYRCVDCRGWEDLTADHVIPESKGGPTTLENLATRCRSCNSRKGVR